MTVTKIRDVAVSQREQVGRVIVEQCPPNAERLTERLSELGDQGGPRVNDQTRDQVRLQELIREFSRRGVMIHDLERGKLDFPALRGDREIYLTWQEGEVSVGSWREIPA